MYPREGESFRKNYDRIFKQREGDVTGRYVWRNGHFIKTSNKAAIPLTTGKVRGGEDYFDYGLDSLISCESQKRRLLKQEGFHVKEPGEMKDRKYKKKIRKKAKRKKAITKALQQCEQGGGKVLEGRSA